MPVMKPQKKRSVLMTEWIDCWDCFQAVVDHFKTHERWKGRSNGCSYYAWGLGAFDGDDATQFASDEKPGIEGAICHPLTIAVLQGGASRLFHLQPRTSR